MTASTQVATDSTDTSQRTCTSIAILIPAYNEEQGIEKAVTSVMKQTVFGLADVAIDVLIIADNCTDKTGPLVLAMERAWPNLCLMRTVNNKSRKAGALNQGFQLLMHSGRKYSFTFTMDADTVLDPHVIEKGLKTMREEDGGICGRVGLLPLEKEPFEAVPFTGKLLSLALIWGLLAVFWKGLSWMFRTFWRHLWWGLQNIEYSIAQSETVERFGWAHCLCGPGTLFRTSVLQEVYDKYGNVWPIDSNVEDFALTKRIQMLGYHTHVGHDMFTYTDCPIGFRSHRLQRERWYSGNLMTYLNVGLNRHTVFDGTDIGLQLLWFVCRLALIMTGVNILRTGFIYIDETARWFLVLPLAATTILNLLRFRYVPYKPLFQFLLLVCLVYELYALWYGIVLVKSYYRAFTRRLRYW